MEALTSLLYWPHIVITIATYFASIAFYRLFFHPLARYPGPKLAALTRWYEAYYDIIHNGQYISRIVEMHMEYGSIVRISPFELHINDPAFFGKLYRQDGRWDKYAWSYDALSAPGATLCTADHDLHKARRQPLGSFFAKGKVTKQQDVVKRNVDKLCNRLFEFTSTSDKTIDLGAATSAFTRDVASEFLLGTSYNNLDHPDFNAGVTVMFQGSGKFWRITKHLRWFGPTMMSIPKDWVIKTADAGTKNFFRFLQRSEQDIKEILASALLSRPTVETDTNSPRTIIHEILDSSLPATEKSFDRIYNDISTIMAAGFETTASVLRLVFFHVFNDPEILSRLRAELVSASIPSDPNAADVTTLEQLPYLTAILMEGMRLSPAISARMQRIAPDRDLLYGAWRVPAGTPVGMTSLLIHEDESLYPEPKRFNPERWMDVETRKRAERTYAPFSRGTRMCLGMHLAWAEMYLVLNALVQLFEFEFQGATAEGFDWESDQFTIGTKGKSVLQTSIRPRRNI